MSAAAITDLMNNLGLLCLGSVVLYLVTRQRRPSRICFTERTLLGASLGVLSLLVVKAPIEAPFGATIDTRAAPLFLAGYFCGPVGAAAAALIGGAARYGVGGPAVIGGVISVVIYAASGWAAERLATRAGWRTLGARGWAAAAVVTSVAVMPTFLIARPVEIGAALLSSVWPVVLIGNVTGLVIMGLLFENIRRSDEQPDSLVS